MKASRYVVDFDSTAAHLRALADCLHGRDFAGPGPPLPAPIVEPLGASLNLLPRPFREQLYIWSGWREAIPPRRLGSVNSEEVAEWMVAQYPRRSYPAVMIGSSGGAAVHLCAALGIPLLPQTFLVAVRRSGVHPDDSRADLEFGRAPGAELLAENPDLQLHHMHDANQDRLMIQRMTYFRLKRLRLGAAFERFLRGHLQPGGTILLNECRQRWPTTRVAERHIFQHGAVGGASVEEMMNGSPRVREYLARYGSQRLRWDPPPPDAERPESEWGFAEELAEDVERFASRHGCRVRRLSYSDPEDLSPLVADLYRWWHGQRGHRPRRLLCGSFILIQPHAALRSPTVPWWSLFNVDRSASRIEAYLEDANGFDEIWMALFSHGVDSIGLAPIERWKQILGRARREGRFLGVDERRYPRDFAGLARYRLRLQRALAQETTPNTEPLGLGDLDSFLSRRSRRHGVDWS